MEKIKNLYKFADTLAAFVVVMQWSDDDDCYEGYVTADALGNDAQIIDRMKRTSLYDDVEITFTEAVELISKARAQYPDRKIFMGEEINIAIDDWNFNAEEQPTHEQEDMVRAYLLGLHKAYNIIDKTNL